MIGGVSNPEGLAESGGSLFVLCVSMNATLARLADTFDENNVSLVENDRFQRRTYRHR
jgi:hypothetical protein